jgi:hypothetical protein
MAQDEAFKQGLQARGDRKWPDAARHMQNAIKADPQESPRKVRSGLAALVGAGTEYLPHYFLGEAYFNMNDCGAAVAAFSISEQQNVLPKARPEFVAAMRKMSQACAAKGVLLAADYNSLNQFTLKVYMDANAMAKRVSDLGAQHRDQWKGDFEEQYKKALDELKTSQGKLSAAQRTRLSSEFNDSKAASDRAVLILRPLEASLNAAIDAVSFVQRLSRDIDEVIAGADATDKAIDSVKATLTDAMQSARKTGREQLSQARDRLATGQKTQSPAVVNDAMKYAQTASTTLNQVLEQLKKAARGAFEQQFREVMVSADEAFSRVSAAISTLDRRSAMRPEVVSQIATERAALEKQVDQLRRRFERARKSEDLAALTDTIKVTMEVQIGLDALIKAFGPLSLRDRGIHASLEEGARHYLEGQYQKALTSLEPLVGQADVPLRVHVHLFRAAALYALFVGSGESKQQLRTQALAEIAQSKQLNSSLQPDARVFPPRFLSLYQTGGAQASQAGAPAAQQ